MVYAKDMYFKVREFFEQFQIEAPVIVENSEAYFERWIFDRTLFCIDKAIQLFRPSTAKIICGGGNSSFDFLFGQKNRSQSFFKPVCRDAFFLTRGNGKSAAI